MTPPTTKPPRAPSPRRRHPVLRDLPPGVWHQRGVGNVPGYPRDAEAFEVRRLHLAGLTSKARADGTLTRQGVPNGWRGRKLEIEAERRNAMTAGELLADVLCPSGDTDDEKMANLGMTYGLMLAMDATKTPAFRLRAAQTVLSFCVSKPVLKAVAATEGGGVGFLMGLAELLKASQGQGFSEET